MSVLSIDQLLHAFSMIGTIVFAVSGALFAAEKRMDILGFILVGTVTGVGGGTLRDLLLGISPVSWVHSPLAVYICIGASALTYFSVDLYRKRDAWILWTDAIGLAVFAVMGAQTAMVHEVPPMIAVVMGVMTATFGGLMRDVLCARGVNANAPRNLYQLRPIRCSHLRSPASVGGYRQHRRRDCFYCRIWSEGGGDSF